MRLEIDINPDPRGVSTFQFAMLAIVRLMHQSKLEGEFKITPPNDPRKIEHTIRWKVRS